MKFRIILMWFLATVLVVGISNADLTYELWEGLPSSLSLLPDFDALGAPTDSGTTDDLAAYIETYSPVDDKSDYGVRFTGYILITQAGDWTFYTSSDDGSKLYIEGVEVVDNDGLHGNRERSGVITLGEGLYAFTVTFWERGGGDICEARYEGPGVAKMIIPNSVLFLTRSTAYAPDPADGEFFRYSTDVTELRWRLPDPNEPPTMTCDVLWFDGDPNLPTTTFELLVDHTIDGPTEQVLLGGRADTPDHYWWRVDVYDVNGLSVTKTEGYLWTFSSARDVAMIWVDESDGSTEVNEQGPTSDTYTISLSMSPASPVTITAASGISRAIEGGDNDVEERQSDPPDGEMDRGSSDLELGYDGNDEQIIGLRFQDLGIPQGATITSATVEFIADSDEAEDVWVTIWGRLDDPGPFTATVWSLSTPGIDDETTAEVEWTILDDVVDDEAFFTPDISSIIQEIVDQPSWSSGNALVIAIGNGNSLGTTPPSSQRRAESYNGNASMAPVLHVEYALGGPGDQVTLSPPVVVLDDTNWEGVEVTVTAVDDDILESDPHTTTLINAVSSADAEWDAVTADDVVVSIIENECGAWSFVAYDFDGNCYVDMGDLAMLIEDWLACSMPNDTNGDCVDYR